MGLPLFQSLVLQYTIVFQCFLLLFLILIEIPGRADFFLLKI
jgi:hypothetical protein